MECIKYVWKYITNLGVIDSDCQDTRVGSDGRINSLAIHTVSKYSVLKQLYFVRCLFYAVGGNNKYNNYSVHVWVRKYYVGVMVINSYAYLT